MDQTNEKNKKIMIPIRMDPKTYYEIQDLVRDEKKKNRGFSINKYVCTLIENNIKETKNE